MCAVSKPVCQVLIVLRDTFNVILHPFDIAIWNRKYLTSAQENPASFNPPLTLISSLFAPKHSFNFGLFSRHWYYSIGSHLKKIETSSVKLRVPMIIFSVPGLKECFINLCSPQYRVKSILSWHLSQSFRMFRGCQKAFNENLNYKNENSGVFSRPNERFCWLEFKDGISLVQKKIAGNKIFLALLSKWRKQSSGWSCLKGFNKLFQTRPTRNEGGMKFI